MKSTDRTKEQLLGEIEDLKKHIADLESSGSRGESANKEKEQSAIDSDDHARFHQLLLDSSLDGYVIADSEENIIGASQAYCELMGYSRDELLKMNIGQLRSHVPSDEVNQRTRDILSHGKARFETQHQHKNGKLLDLEATIIVSRFEEHIMMIGFMRDISERKLALEALKDNEYLLRESQKVARLGSYTLDFSTGLWSCSSIMDEIFGIDESFKKDVPGWIGMLSPDIREEMTNYFETLVAEKQRWFDKEYRIPP